MNEKIEEQDLWCEYSDLPSPKAYINCADYDSMGNHGRFPKTKDKKDSMIKRQIQKFLLWLTIRFPKKKRKDIWDL